VLSQARLAEAAHVSDEWVRRIERGEGTPSLDTVEAIAEALSCTPEELFVSASADGLAVDSFMQAARRMTAEELAWVEEAIRLITNRPRR
jgi:transcriptional regulator with XRE-family HTH domain